MLSILSSIFILSAQYKMDPYLVAAIVETESKFNPRAIGSYGEIGLMQLRPKYFDHRQGKLFSPYHNLELGVAHLKELSQRCPHKKEMTFVICFNAGVKGSKRIKNAKANQYYRRFKSNYASFKRIGIFKSFLNGQNPRLQALRVKASARPI